MSQDVFKPKGKLKKYEAGAGKQQAADVPIIATVMNNIAEASSFHRLLIVGKLKDCLGTNKHLDLICTSLGMTKDNFNSTSCF